MMIEKTAGLDGVLSGNAYKRIEKSGLSGVFVTNSLPINRQLSTKIKVIDISPFFDEVILRVYLGESVSELY